VAIQRAEIDAARAGILTAAVAREKREAMPAPPPAPAADGDPVGSVGWHRAQSRAWAREHGRITDEQLRMLTALARDHVVEGSAQ
jgi:hypothetical protein